MQDAIVFMQVPNVSTRSVTHLSAKSRVITTGHMCTSCIAPKYCRTRIFTSLSYGLKKQRPFVAKISYLFCSGHFDSPIEKRKVCTFAHESYVWQRLNSVTRKENVWPSDDTIGISNRIFINMLYSSCMFAEQCNGHH